MGPSTTSETPSEDWGGVEGESGSEVGSGSGEGAFIPKLPLRVLSAYSLGKTPLLAKGLEMAQTQTQGPRISLGPTQSVKE